MTFIQISKYICIKKFTRVNNWIQSNNKFDMNEYPNKCLYEYLNITEYSNSLYSLTHTRTKIQIYSYNKILYGRKFKYIPKLTLWNVWINICDKYIWIFDYIRHTLHQNHNQDIAPESKYIMIADFMRYYTRTTRSHGWPCHLLKEMKTFQSNQIVFQDQVMQCQKVDLITL